jgi:general secretion pathway protein D
MCLPFLRFCLGVCLIPVAVAAPFQSKGPADQNQGPLPSAPMPMPVPGDQNQGPRPTPVPGSDQAPAASNPPSVPAGSNQNSVPAVVATAEGEMVGPIKLADADIDTLLGALEIYTGRTILRPQSLPAATYTLKLTKPVPKAEAVLALETLLALNGVGVAPLGEKFLKVVALTQVKSEAPEMIEGSTLGRPASGQVATKLFQFEFLRVAEFVPQITPLLSSGIASGVVTLEKANAVLITDSISNLQRIENLLRLLDRPSSSGLTPKFYTLHNGAKASDVVTRLRTMFSGPLQAQLGSATTYSADDRTNQVILLADPRQYPLFDDLIAKLDVKADPNTRNEVIYLKHATAKDVATLLSSLVSGQNSAAQKPGEGSTRTGQSPVAPPANPPAGASPAAAALASLSEASNNFSSLITILADDRSNAIVVSGTVDDIRLIRDLVEKVDILLAQVRIEVVIAEVTLSDTDKSGISALGLTVGQNPAGATKITKFTGSVAGWDITSGIVDPLSFAAAMSDSGSKNNVKVLSAPMIMTTHNKEAEVKVGQRQPIITGSTSTPTTASTSGITTQSQVNYVDIAIDLKVTPLIGDDGVIQLKISQTVDDVVGTVKIDANDQPIIGTRVATSFVNVKDGQMLVLGGLQRTKNNLTRNKIGFLAEIPILSQIFGARTKTVERTELLLFIRPHVVPPGEGLEDTRKDIEKQSNKSQIDEFLTPPPAKAPQQ